jgi:dTDP-4-amino-4,6-dideoxygalactose transaminase
VDFVDIDAQTYNMSPACLAAKLEHAERAGKLPKIVVPVHLAGLPCDLRAIRGLSERYGFRIIEDASHAIGAEYRGAPVGNCEYSDIAVFSFHPVKIITTGEGGMALTNDSGLASRMRLLRSHGITRDPARMRAPLTAAPWYYEQIALGYNYRMTDIQAALGLSQLHRLSQFISTRQAIADRYSGLLAGLPVTTPWQHPEGRSALHLYIVRLNLDRIGKSHVEVFNEMRAGGIGVNLHYIPVYRQPYYQQLGFPSGYCLQAERYYAEAMTLPLFPPMTIEQQRSVVAALAGALS